MKVRTKIRKAVELASDSNGGSFLIELEGKGQMFIGGVNHSVSVTINLQAQQAAFKNIKVGDIFEHEISIPEDPK